MIVSIPDLCSLSYFLIELSFVIKIFVSFTFEWAFYTDFTVYQNCIIQRNCCMFNKGSYMSAHVLLNLLNKLGKRDKMRGRPSILSLFRNEFNKFNNTRARMLDSIYHMTNYLKSHFWRKNVMILSSCTQRCYGVITFPVNR